MDVSHADFFVYFWLHGHVILDGVTTAGPLLTKIHFLPNQPAILDVFQSQDRFLRVRLPDDTPSQITGIVVPLAVGDVARGALYIHHFEYRDKAPTWGHLSRLSVNIGVDRGPRKWKKLISTNDQSPHSAHRIKYRLRQGRQSKTFILDLLTGRIYENGQPVGFLNTRLDRGSLELSDGWPEREALDLHVLVNPFTCDHSATVEIHHLSEDPDPLVVDVEGPEGNLEFVETFFDDLEGTEIKSPSSETWGIEHDSFDGDLTDVRPDDIFRDDRDQAGGGGPGVVLLSDVYQQHTIPIPPGLSTQFHAGSERRRREAERFVQEMERDMLSTRHEDLPPYFTDDSRHSYVRRHLF